MSYSNVKRTRNLQVIYIYIVKHHIYIYIYIFRCKVHSLYLLTISKLKELRVLSWGLYSKLDDWIINGIKLENQEIYQFLNFIRNSIQNNQKSVLKLQEHPLISSLYKPLNYLTAISYNFPVIEGKYYENTENSSKNKKSKKNLQNKPKFLITELKLLFEDVKTLASNENYIEKRVLEEYLLRRKSHKETQKQLPMAIVALNDSYIKKMLEKIDINKNSLINWKLFLNSMSLLASPVINEEKNQQMKESIGDEKTIDIDYFMNMTFWFDSSENEEENGAVNRGKFLKKLLFEINGNDEVINIKVWGGGGLGCFFL